VGTVVTGLSHIQVQTKSHLLALSRVSKKFRFLVFPRLFEVLTIKANNETSPWDLQQHPYFDRHAIARVPKVLTTVKELCFSAPFELTELEQLGDGKRCLHSFDPYTSFMDSLGSEADLLIPREDDVTVTNEDAKHMEDVFDGEDQDMGLTKLAIKLAQLLLALPDDQLTCFR
jgi:hypothetical protein